MKIKKTFAYMGSKGRFYKEIKEIFQENYKKHFVDLFAGAMEVTLNVKEEFGEVTVLANVKDEFMEGLIRNRKHGIKLYKKAVEHILNGETITSGRAFYEDKKKWLGWKEKFHEITRQNILKLASHEIKALQMLMSVKQDDSLSSNFYSIQKLQNLEKYLQKMENIHIKHEFFNKNWQFDNSFILLDPPYVTSTGTKERGTKGYRYKAMSWTEQDDMALIEFIQKNKEKGNVFLVFGSVENTLSKLIQKSFPQAIFTVKKYKKSMFGRSSEREEWYCVIK